MQKNSFLSEIIGEFRGTVKSTTELEKIIRFLSFQVDEGKSWKEYKLSLVK